MLYINIVLLVKLHVKSVKAKMGIDKLEKINVKLQNMLSDNWHKSDTDLEITPFTNC